MAVVVRARAVVAAELRDIDTLGMSRVDSSGRVAHHEESREALERSRVPLCMLVARCMLAANNGAQHGKG